jgi:DNA-binding response OmpR family regulator
MSSSRSPTGPSTAPPTRRVLLVENDYLVAQTIADSLVDLRCTVVGPAYRLDEACQIAAAGSFDAALLDWSLDGTSSGDVAAILIRRQIPFAFVTGHDRVPDLRYGHIPVLGKPISMNDLGRTVEAMLRNTPAH